MYKYWNFTRTLIVLMLLGSLAATPPSSGKVKASGLVSFTALAKQDYQILASLQTADAGVASTVYNWVDITETGTPLTLSDWGDDDDEGEASVPLPWAFPWFGNSYTDLVIDPNGNVGFDQWLGITYNGDNRIPSPGTPNNRISAFYEDMAGPNDGACDNTGNVYIYYDNSGDRFIVQYDHWCSWEDSQLNTFEVILYPDGQVIVQYNSVPSAPSNLSFGDPAGDSQIGVEGPGGLNGYPWVGTAADGTAWVFGQDIPLAAMQIYLPLLQSRTGGFQTERETNPILETGLTLSGDSSTRPTSLRSDSPAYFIPDNSGERTRIPDEDRCHNALKAASRISP